MGKNGKKPEEDDAAGAPEWMVTFSDCMTLLLTFFVLLLSFSSFDNRIFRRLKVIYSRGLTTITPSIRSDRDALSYIPPILYVSDLDKGSEKPTLEIGNEDGLLNATEPYDFNRGIVFMLPSNKLFWGNGIAISNQGQSIIDTMAQFLKGVSHRILISEHGDANDTTSESLGLQRAWAVMNYLTTKKNIDKKRFSISSISTFSQKGNENTGPNPDTAGLGRTLEIVLLARNIYN
jgi:chemotaxis protein MotB